MNLHQIQQKINLAEARWMGQAAVFQRRYDYLDTEPRDYFTRRRFWYLRNYVKFQKRVYLYKVQTAEIKKLIYPLVSA